MKNQKGITLIALVVTIVVLLILAGTSIAMLSGDNGIITNAQNANYANTEGEVMDKIRFAYNTISTEVRIRSTTESNYDATEKIAELVTLVKDDLGITSSTDPKNRYTVTSDTNTITVTYSDKIFGKPTDTNAKFNAIEYVFTVAADKVTITNDYTRQVNANTK